MTNIKRISEKISSVSSTKQITKAMKMVATSKFGKLHSMTISLNEFFGTIKKVIGRINLEEKDLKWSNFFNDRKTKKASFIVIGSDKGLCGAYNNNLFKFAKKNISDFKEKFPEVAISVVPIGEKSRSFFEKSNFSLKKNYVHLCTEFEMEEVKKLSSFLKKEFEEKKLDKIFLIYTNLKSSSVYIPCIEQYLPIKISDLKDNILDSNNLSVEQNQEYIFEGSKERTLSVLLPNYLDYQIYSAILNSKSSENSSRMITMSKAVDNSESLLKDLTLKFNRGRQAIITQEISEVSSGAEFLNN